MKEKIEQLARGNFDYEPPRILVSEEEITITVETGSTYQGSFSIQNSEGSRMKGVLYSSSRLLCIETDKFIGETTQIRYHYVADYQNSGDECHETISIISDCGELTIPVHIIVEAPYCETSLGKIKDLFQFANLAKVNWTEAKQVFKSEKFEKMVDYYDKQHLLLYQSLVKSSSISQALDEFLVATHKKTAVIITIDKSDSEYDAGPYNFMDKFKITKDGWGYQEVRISTNASFLELERKIVWVDNFINNECEINYVIKTEGMKEGIHYGTIVVETVSQKLCFHIKVRCNRSSRNERLKQRKVNHVKSQLVKNYLDFRFNRISSSKYVAEAEVLLKNLTNYDRDQVDYALYHLHLQLIAGRDVAFSSALFAFEEKYDELRYHHEVSYGILLYLKTLRKKSNVDIAAAYNEIQEIYSRNSDSYLLFWCLCYLDKQYETNHSKKYQDIKQLYEQGVKSPILYYEAAALVLEDSSLLRSLDGFERQLVVFLLRQKVLTKELAAIVSYLIGKEKVFMSINLMICKRIYEQFKIKEALQVLLSLLIRSHNRSNKYHSYFEAGVNQQLRVTELPEYYVYTMNEELYVPIHPSVLAYFNFNNSLPEKKRAFYYCCLLENAKTNPEILNQHREEILEFILQQLRNHCVNVHLCVLCDTLITQETLTKELASLLPELSFLYVLECPNQKIKSVSVYHKELKLESNVPIHNQKAYVYLWTENAKIVLIDNNEQRYHATIGYALRKVSHLEGLYDKMYELAPDNANLVLYLSDKAQYYQKFDSRTIELRKQVTLLSNLTKEYQKNFLQTLIHYYYDNFEGEILENYLMQIDLHLIERNGRSKIIEFMIVRDLDQIAFKAMAELGYEGVDLKRLLKLCSRVIANADGVSEKVDILVEISHYVFIHGRYDVPVLEYLNRYFNGTTSEMFALWRTSKDNNLDTSDLEERLLGQMLFTESYMSDAKAVFMSYYHNGCNRKLIRAFLSYYSYKYLIFDRSADVEIFDVIRQELNYEDNEIAMQAYLKYESTLEYLADSEIKYIDYQLSVFEQKGILLPFYQNFQRNMRIPQSMYDKFYVEYRTNPKHKVFIHYSLEGEEINGEYCVEEMNNLYYGIFVKEFILFQGETLQYYISEIIDGKEVITKSQTVTIEPEMQQYEENNYHRINQIIEARELRDEATMNRLLETYVKLDYSIDAMFRPII